VRSLRGAAHEHLRIEAPLTVRSVATELAVPARSARDLLDRLDQHKVSHFSGSLLPSSVKGSATFELTSDGFWSFSGHVHENGFIGHKYVFAAGPDFSDPDGNGFVVAQESSVTDSRDSDFEQHGWDPRISAYWDQLRQVGVSFRLEVDIRPGDVLKSLAGVLALAGVIVLVLNPLAADAGIKKIEIGDGTSQYYRNPE
jgi:hypothetical protein